MNDKEKIRERIEKKVRYVAYHGTTLTTEGMVAKAVEDLEALTTTAINKELEAIKVNGETSDGYHTFNELYDYRRVYNAALFNEWYKQGGKHNVHKSWRHSDGELCFGGGWFIVMADLPTGQISNHYEAKYWDDFQIPERPTANTYDGHTPQEALDRLTKVHQIIDTHLEGGEDE